MIVGPLLAWWLFGPHVAVIFLAGAFWQMLMHGCPACERDHAQPHESIVARESAAYPKAYK